VTPSGNIGCDFSLEAPQGVGCGILSYSDNLPYGSENGYPNWWIYFQTDGSTFIGAPSARDFTPLFMQPAAQEVPYNTAAYYGDFVCGSAEAGLTCWTTQTGHGAFITRDNYTAF
jgi:hypothetical protein